MVIKLFNSSLIDPLRQLAKNDPEKLVLASSSEQLSASQLFNASKNIAINLIKEGFKDGETVVLAMVLGREFLEVFYSLLMAGARIAIIDPDMGRDNYAAKVKQLNPSWMFVDGRLLFLDEWPLVKRLGRQLGLRIPEISFDVKSKLVKTGINIPVRKPHVSCQNLKRSFTELSDLTPLHFRTNNENMIVYTSGTLDVPKGVLHSDKSLSSTITRLIKIISGKPTDVVATSLPHFALLGCAAGLVVRIIPTNLRPLAKLRWLEAEQINILFAAPSELLPLILYCEIHRKQFPRSLTHLMLGSAPVHQSFLVRLIKVLKQHVKITCTYGMTEHLLVSVADGREKATYAGSGDLLGKTVEGVQVKIADDKEILVKSDQLFSRYYHLDHQNEWHATGDLGAFDENYNLVLLGRKKEMIIRKDFNIYPALYEGTIKRIRGVDEAVMVGIYDETIHDEKVYLALQGTHTISPTVMRLIKQGRFSIDKQALPDVVFDMEIPRNGRHNKVNRSAIVKYIQEHGL